MVLAYRMIDLADYCYIFEVTHWLAIGELPERVFNEEGSEARLDPHSHDDTFEPAIDANLTLDNNQVELFLPGVDVVAYNDALLRVLDYRSPGEILERAEDLAAQITETRVDESEALAHKILEEAESEAEAAKWLIRVHKNVQHSIDEARAKTFLHLAKGELKARGFACRQDEEKGYQYCEVVDIPPECWTWDTINWDLAATTVEDVKVIGAHVETAAMLKLHPEPDCQLKDMAGKAVGTTFLANCGATNIFNSNAKRPKRGRPPIADRTIEKATIKEYGRRKARGNLAQKQEANICAMIEWIKEIFDEDVSRTSVQRWLSPLKNAQN